MAELIIGEMLGSPGVPAVLDATKFNRHTFWCGQSGSGKTYALGVVPEQLLLHTELPILVLDPNADFVRLPEMRPNASEADAARWAELDLRVFRSGGAEGAAWRISRCSTGMSGRGVHPRCSMSLTSVHGQRSSTSVDSRFPPSPGWPHLRRWITCGRAAKSDSRFWLWQDRRLAVVEALSALEGTAPRLVAAQRRLTAHVADLGRAHETTRNDLARTRATLGDDSCPTPPARRADDLQEDGVP